MSKPATNNNELCGTLLAEVKAVGRTITDADLVAATAKFGREFAASDSGELTRAFDEWMHNQGESTIYSLPSPAQIWGIILRHRKQAAADQASVGNRRFKRPRREFLEQWHAVNVAAGIIPEDTEGAGLLTAMAKTAFSDDSLDHLKHDHTTKEPDSLEWGSWKWDQDLGRRVWVGCGKCKAIAYKIAKIAKALEALPVPEEGETRACRCDGSQWVNTKASEASLLTPAPFVELYPCPDCNAEQFHAWREDGKLPA